MNGLTAVVADRVWTPGAGVAERAMVLIDGQQIVATDRAAHAPADAEVVDLGNVTVLPGLVDAHLHLCFDASTDVLSPVLEIDDDELRAGIDERLEALISTGITTVRDLGDRRFITLEARQRLREQPTTGPELLVAGPPITRRQGHCWFFGGEADTAEELRAAVAERGERGCDVVKVMATGGVLTPGFLPHESQYTADELRVIVEAAHELGLPVAAHAHGEGGVRDAVSAGVDSVEHCSFATDTGVEVDWDVVDEMVRQGIYASFTIGSLPGSVPPPAVASRMAAMGETIKRMHEIGARVVASSDAGIAPGKPHNVLPYTAVALTSLGIANDAALTSVTATAADACGVGDRKGRVAPGFDADLIAVAGDPLQDAGALHDVTAVFRAGTQVR